jgi:hypothetical protein
VANDLAANLDQPVSNCRQRPVLHGVGQSQGGEEVGQPPLSGPVAMLVDIRSLL